MRPRFPQPPTMDPIIHKSIATTQWKPSVTTIGTYQRPWIRVTRHEESETAFVMAHENFRIECYFVHTRLATERYSVVLDTCGGSSMTQILLIPRKLQHHNRPLENHRNVQYASKDIKLIAGTIALLVNVGNQSSANVTFKVIERMVIEVILKSDFYNAHIVAIRPRQKSIKLIGGTAVSQPSYANVLANPWWWIWHVVAPIKRLPNCLQNLASISEKEKIYGSCIVWNFPRKTGNPPTTISQLDTGIHIANKV